MSILRNRKILLVLITIILFMALLHYSSIKNVFTLFSLSRKPESFTELSFVDHLNLPKEVEVGKQYSFSFKVHNLEGQPINYLYKITTTENDRREVLGEGEFELRQNEHKEIPFNFSFSEQFKRKKLAVILSNKSQEIHFWIESI